MRHESMVREHLAAVCHGDAYPNPKKAAAANRVCVRTARRWRNPDEAKGSRQDTYTRYIEAAEHPWRIVAANEVTAMQQTVKKWDKDKLIAEYRAVLKRDKHGEARDTANSLDPSVPWLERAVDSERDAADDVLKAACERELAIRDYPVAEVMGCEVWRVGPGERK
jgi:hypothetical protein